jgi:ribosome-binding factor A
MNTNKGSRRKGYDRVARLNSVLREVVAEEIEREAEYDDRLVLLTVTEVAVDPDLKRARVFFASLPQDKAEALAEVRVSIQHKVATEMRMKRTPLLSFELDPSLEAGEKIDAILRRVAKTGQEADGD